MGREAWFRMGLVAIQMIAMNNAHLNFGVLLIDSIMGCNTISALICTQKVVRIIVVNYFWGFPMQ